MAVFKSYSSVSHKHDKEIMKYLYKDIQIDDDSQDLDKDFSKGLKIDNTQRLDDIVGAVLDFVESKGLSDKAPVQMSKKEALGMAADLTRIGIAKQMEKAGPIDKFFYKIFEIKPSKDPNAWLTPLRAKSITYFLTKITQIAILHLFSMFVHTKLDRFTAMKISESFRSKKLYRWMTMQIKEIYRKYPQYRPMSIDQFKKTRLWSRFTAEWRDKTQNQRIRRLSKRMLVIIILILVKKLPFPSPLTSLYCIPARIILAYLGCQLAVGSINTIVIEHEGNSIIMGLTLTRFGLELVHPQLVVMRNDGKMVNVDLPRIPLELYAITKQDIDNHKMVPIDELKKKVESNNDSTE